VLAQHRRVAGQFLVVVQRGQRPPRQRMEPEQRGKDSREQAPPAITTARMGDFVGENQRLLHGVVALFEIGGQHDPAAPGAHQRRPDVRTAGTQHRPWRAQPGHH
jgi:hypothetical protein